MIGGRDLMGNKFSIGRNLVYSNNLSHIRHAIENHSRLSLGITYDKATTYNVLENLSLLLFSDLKKMMVDDDEIIRVKYNRYSLTFFSKSYKAKVYLGLSRDVAAENFQIAKHFFNKDYNFIELLQYSCENRYYHIEIYKFINECTVEDCIYVQDYTGGGNIKRKEVYDSVNNNGPRWLLKLFQRYLFNHIIDNVEHGFSLYPNDMNIGNFIVMKEETDINMINIDYDHIVKTTTKHAVHNVSWQFISRIFDKERMPDEKIGKEFEEYRKVTTLFDEVEQFKSDLFSIKKIDYDSEKECFDYDVTIEMLNGSVELYEEYLKTKKRLFKNAKDVE